MKAEIDKWQKERTDYLVVAISCFIIGTYSFIMKKSGSNIIKSSELKTIENLIISEKPVLKTGKRGKRIKFKCVNNKSTFEIANFDYECANNNQILNKIKNNDTISLKISNNDMKNFNNEANCEIHSLQLNKEEYLNIECRNKAKNKDGQSGYILLFSISVMTSMVYSFSQKPEVFNKINPKFPIFIVAIILFIVLF